MEDRFDFERLFGFDVQKNDGALRVHGHEESFAHREGVTGIENRGGFRPHGQGAGERFGWENTAFGEKVQMKFAEKFQWIDPRFHFAALVAE